MGLRGWCLGLLARNNVATETGLGALFRTLFRIPNAESQSAFICYTRRMTSLDAGTG